MPFPFLLETLNVSIKINIRIVLTFSSIESKFVSIGCQIFPDANETPVIETAIVTVGNSNTLFVQFTFFLTGDLIKYQSIPTVTASFMITTIVV